MWRRQSKGEVPGTGHCAVGTWLSLFGITVTITMSVIVVSGAIANKYLNGGEAWVRLSWVLGFRKLGFQVFFVEQISAGVCVDYNGDTAPFEECANLAYFRREIEESGLSGSATLVYGEGHQTWGLTFKELQDIAGEADLLINISGHLTLEPLLSRMRRKAYIDIDPGFTQFWHLAGNTGLRLQGHDFYYTIGENIGKPGCPIPTSGIEWRPTRQPVVLEDWPACGASDPGRFTTVANWRGPYGRIEHQGKSYGLKVHEFRKFMCLPQLAPDLVFELALNIHPADHKDLDALLDHGWRIVDPKAVASTAKTFREFVQGSGAEFSVAQGIYAETASGWFSDRTVRYLASGKPALVQDTGFTSNLPAGEGLLAFNTVAEAVAGATRIAGDYQQHSRAARGMAEEYFDSDKVLRRLVDEVGVAP